MAMTRAYILIETGVGQSVNVVNALVGKPGVLSADRVAGPYDVIAVIEADGLKSVGDFVTEHVHTIGGIIRTVTCLAVG
jgi:DNA-binding Lrp family transcriptional regulator